jgi:hypothetical protein
VDIARAHRSRAHADTRVPGANAPRARLTCGA